MKDMMEILESPSIERITEFQREHLKLPQIEPPMEHYFADGLYGREMLLRAGESCVGATHGKEHLCIVMGHCMVVDGTSKRELIGWNVLISHPGAKRVILAIQDTVWLTVHATKLKDIHEIEQEILLPEDEPNRFFPHGKNTIGRDES